MDWGMSTIVIEFPGAGPEGMADALLDVESCERVHGNPARIEATFVIGGNVGPLGCLTSIVSDVEEALADEGVEPPGFSINATWKPRQ